MPKDKYTLPVVDSLEEIGFQFEYAKLNEAIPYIQSFVDANIGNLVSLFFPNQLDWAYPDRITGTKIAEPEYAIVRKIKRIENGKIYATDFLRLVPAMHRNNKPILLKALNNKLRTLYGAKGNLIYRGKRLGLDLDTCIKECLYHLLLDCLIQSFALTGKIPPTDFNEYYSHYFERYIKYDSKAKELEDSLPGQPGSLLYRMYSSQALKDLRICNDELFSTNISLEKTARIVISNALGQIAKQGPILSSIEAKEKTIRYYLKLQSESVQKSKDSKKGNKGIHSKKHADVITIYKSDPDQSISKIAKLSGVTWKTAKKIIDGLDTM
jgi:hypothetical protein